MELFTEDHFKRLLEKPWLAKNDGTKDIYLFKFADMEDGSLVLVVTNTMQCWYEVLPIKRAVKRWKDCNSNIEDAYDFSADSGCPDLVNRLLAAHTSSGFDDADFSLIQSDYDISFKFNFDLEWIWEWDLTRLGPKRASELLSKHLILPMILSDYVALQNMESMPSFKPAAWDKMVDTAANQARRAITNQIKGAVSRPIFANTLQRITCGVNGVSMPDSNASQPPAPAPAQQAKAQSNFEKASAKAGPSSTNHPTHDLRTKPAEIPSSPPQSSPAKKDAMDVSEDERIVSPTKSTKGKEAEAPPPTPTAPNDDGSDTEPESDRPETEPEETAMVTESPKKPVREAFSESDEELIVKASPRKKLRVPAPVESDESGSEGDVKAVKRPPTKPPSRRGGRRKW